MREGFEREICYEYIAVKNADVNEVKKVLEEAVQDVKYIDYLELKKLVQSNDPDYIIDDEARRMVVEIEKFYSVWKKDRGVY
ncbi:MAG: hypothetical protein HPY66_3606 [Firmicutes bacterium]|nr:hypothetical protein [Bacillota bacterium]